VFRDDAMISWEQKMNMCRKNWLDCRLLILARTLNEWKGVIKQISFGDVLVSIMTKMDDGEFSGRCHH